MLARLTADPRVRTHHIAVAVVGDAVTLSGHVISEAQKDAAGFTAQGVKGVGQMTNGVRLAVLSMPTAGRAA